MLGWLPQILWWLWGQNLHRLAMMLSETCLRVAKPLTFCGSCLMLRMIWTKHWNMEVHKSFGVEGFLVRKACLSEEVRSTTWMQ